MQFIIQESRGYRAASRCSQQRIPIPGSRSLLEAECGHFFLAEQLQSVVPQARPCGSGDRQSGTYKLRFSVQLRQS